MEARKSSDLVPAGTGNETANISGLACGEREADGAMCMCALMQCVAPPGRDPYVRGMHVHTTTMAAAAYMGWPVGRGRGLGRWQLAVEVRDVINTTHLYTTTHISIHIARKGKRSSRSRSESVDPIFGERRPDRYTATAYCFEEEGMILSPFHNSCLKFF